MKRLFSIALVLVLILSAAQFVVACSSFAVYGKNGPVIGMNVDWPAYGEAQESPDGRFFEQRDNRVAINFHGDTKVFRYDHHFFFNDWGVFGCAQEAWPPQRMERSYESLIHWHPTLYALGAEFEKATDIVEVLEGARLRDLRDADFHCLFADSQGNAIIVEPGVDQNHLLPMEGNYIVMTNFFHHLLDGDYTDPFFETNPHVTFMDFFDPDRRYRMAETMIQSSLDDFDYIKALEVLEAVTQPITKFSIVIAPEQKQLYIALFRDFSRIWQVDLEAETIATYLGFADYRIEKLDVKGWTVDELMEWR